MADELAPGSDLGTGLADAAPSAIEISETSLIKAPGLDKPVAYKDFISGYVPKSDLTRMRQQDAAALRSEREALQREQAQLTRASQQLAQRLAPQNGQQAADPFRELESAAFIDGKTAAGLMRQVVAGMQQNHQRYEQTIALLTDRLARAEQGFTSLQGRSRQADTQALFDQTRTKLGLADHPDVKAMIESEYHAHDGWDTVSADERLEHLSTVVKRRYDALMGLFKTDQQKRVDEARKRPVVPPAQNPRLKATGSGMGSKSAEKLADELWPLVSGSPQT